MSTVYQNINLVTAEGIQYNTIYIVRDDDEDEVFDGNGGYIAPGLLDYHIHGAGGFTSDKETLEESLIGMASFLNDRGITQFQLTTAYDLELLKMMKALLARNNFLREHIVGIYIEGPYINPVKIGGLPPDSIHPCNINLLEEILSLNIVTTMTVAPELPGSDVIIKRLKENGVVVSYGHSNVYYDEVIKTDSMHITHLYNAMQDLNHKRTGLAALPFLSDATYELICDTVHVDEAMLELTIKTLKCERMLLISDGMTPCGMGKCETTYSGKKVYCDGKACYYADTNTLVGSEKLISETGKELYDKGLIGAFEFFKIASFNPRKRLSLSTVLKDNNLVLFDKDLNFVKCL